MLLNPNSKKIICFGDSLTWGVYHDDIRFPLKDRWTYKLQEILGQEFDIVEEGLRSRTTNIEDQDIPDRNGFPYLRACLESHFPADILIYMLGTNDTKIKFNKSVDDILSNIQDTINWVKDFDTQKNTNTKIILVSPPKINLNFLKKTSTFDQSSNNKIIELGEKMSELTKKLNIPFLNLSTIMEGAKEDGIHLSVEDNQKIVEELSLLIQKFS